MLKKTVSFKEHLTLNVCLDIEFQDESEFEEFQQKYCNRKISFSEYAGMLMFYRICSETVVPECTDYTLSNKILEV